MTMSAVVQEPPMGERLGAVAGIGAALILIGIIVVVPTGPSADASGDEIKAALLAQGDAMLVGHYLEGLTVMLFLWFAASLHSVLRRAEEGNGTLAATMLGGAVATVAVILVAHAIQASLALRTTPDGDPALIRALFALAAMVDAFFAFPLAVFLAATGAAMVGSGAVSRWLGWAASVLALLLVVGMAGTLTGGGPLSAVGVVGFLLFVLWLLAASIALLRRRGAARTVVRDAPAL